MLARVYVSMHGCVSDLEKFHARAAKVVGGEFRHRKAGGSPAAAGLPPDCWVCRETRTRPEKAADRLSELFAKLLPMMADLRRPAVRIFAHVELEFDRGEEPVALYFPQRLMTLLNEAGADLDIGTRTRTALAGRNARR